MSFDHDRLCLEQLGSSGACLCWIIKLAREDERLYIAGDSK